MISDYVNGQPTFDYEDVYAVFRSVTEEYSNIDALYSLNEILLFTSAAFTQKLILAVNAAHAEYQLFQFNK